MPKAFVYGAQMARPEWPGEARSARVRGRAVRFVAAGVPLLEPAFASLEVDEDAEAFGVVFDYSDEDWRDVVALEKDYQVVEVEAEFLDGREPETARALAFQIRESQRSDDELAPSSRYARKLVRGARAHGLPEPVIAHYEALEAQGSRLTLGLVWLRPLATRIGLMPTAVLLAAVFGMGVVALVWLAVG